ncbi:MAG TPA: hypothetical protein VEP67_02630 [Thiobacillaceae bacterium]|nr:hypothetical protein [Thiobacillaceae bacterium]
MCYELYFKSKKLAQDQKAEKAKAVMNRITTAKPPGQRQPVNRTKEKQELETELETGAAA